MTYTKGPWHRNIKPASRYPVIYAGRNTHVAQVITQGLPDAEIEGNCELIRQAPQIREAAADMLAALKEYKRCGLSNDAADAAIAAAEAAGL
jgi:hypothetical protein